MAPKKEDSSRSRHEDRRQESSRSRHDDDRRQDNQRAASVGASAQGHLVRLNATGKASKSRPSVKRQQGEEAVKSACSSASLIGNRVRWARKRLLDAMALSNGTLLESAIEQAESVPEFTRVCASADCMHILDEARSLLKLIRGHNGNGASGGVVVPQPTTSSSSSRSALTSVASISGGLSGVPSSGSNSSPGLFVVSTGGALTPPRMQLKSAAPSDGLASKAPAAKTLTCPPPKAAPPGFSGPPPKAPAPKALSLPAPKAPSSGVMDVMDSTSHDAPPRSKAQPKSTGMSLERAAQMTPGDGFRGEEKFENMIRQFMKVVKATVLTEEIGMTSKCIRRVETEEIVEVLKCPIVEESMQVGRMQVKALSDEVVGWITPVGNQGTVYLDEGGILFKVVKETILTSCFVIGTDKERTRKVKVGEIVECCEWARKEPNSGFERMKVRVKSDGTIGWATSVDNTGIVFLEAKPPPPGFVPPEVPVTKESVDFKAPPPGFDASGTAKAPPAKASPSALPSSAATAADMAPPPGVMDSPSHDAPPPSKAPPLGVSQSSKANGREPPTKAHSIAAMPTLCLEACLFSAALAPVAPELAPVAGVGYFMVGCADRFNSFARKRRRVR